MADYRFTFSGLAVAETPDPFGVWEAPAAEIKAPPVPGLTWRAELPEAAAGLEAVHARLATLERGEVHLAQAEAELRAALETITPIAEEPVAGATTYAFSIPPEERFHPQKQALRNTLSGFAALEAPQMTGVVAFGAADVFAEDQEREGFQEAYRRWLAFVEQVRQLTSFASTVETLIAGERIGLTRVSWDGDFETFWVSGLATLSRETHRQNVNLVLASRVALLRLISVVAIGAGGLIAKSIALPPGGQVLLIPAAVRFISDVMAALREWDAAQG
ncbi:MAG TPA: hypothetical protein PLJ78_07870 [Anaerolineae bacterium]|nr:hypothetical protein [Anaerolineae bacterium]HQK13842.1 hypothetical protein [Anaerolineae bacterium]